MDQENHGILEQVRGNLSVTGIIKNDYPGYDVYITPATGVEVLAGCGAGVVVMDAGD